MKNRLFQEIDALQLEINAYRPLDEHLLLQIKEYYRIGLTYTSNALEGNSLTEAETKIVIEEGITIGGKRIIDHLEAIGHSQAFDLLYTLSQSKTITLNDIKALHRLFYFRIDPIHAGVWREVKVFISGSHYAFPAPQEIDSLMTSFENRLNELRGLMHPVELAALIHKEFVFIHPYIDGNGRVGRLLMNLILMQYGCHPITSIPPILRSDYIRFLKSHTNDTDFILFIAKMVKDPKKNIYGCLFKCIFWSLRQSFLKSLFRTFDV